MTSRHTALHFTFVAITTSLLIGCGGGGGGGGDGGSTSAPPPPPKNASPGGIWKGTASSGQSLVGIVTETGEFTFVQDDGVQYFCNMSVSADKVSAGFTGIAPFGTTFDTGASSGGGSLSGTVVERNSMSGSIEFTAAAAPTSGSGKVSGSNAAEAGSKPCGAAATSLATNKSGLALDGTAAAALARHATEPAAAGPSIVAGTFNLTFDAQYDRESALATLAGNFDLPDGTIVTVDTNGRIFSQNPATGCIVNGLASIVDPNYNVYRVSYTFSSCTAELAVLNGAKFEGLATLDDSSAPEQAIVAVRYVSDTHAFGLVQILTRT